MPAFLTVRPLTDEESHTLDRLAPTRTAPARAVEREVLALLAGGLPDKAIAARLDVSPDTVRSHMVKILVTLGVASRLRALLFALRHGAITLDHLAAAASHILPVAEIGRADGSRPGCNGGILRSPFDR